MESYDGRPSGFRLVRVTKKLAFRALYPDELTVALNPSQSGPILDGGLSPHLWIASARRPT